MTSSTGCPELSTAVQPNPELNLVPRPRFLERRAGATAWVTATHSEDRSIPDQGYRLQIGEQIDAWASSKAGHFYADQTLQQLRLVSPEHAPRLLIQDWPDVPTRGVMLDVSRSKVPTMTTMRDLIRRLASWKYNHLQLYMESSFAYSAHESVWAGSDPFTAAEIAELDHLCRELHIELAPNQNCLGHMERWLRHPHYAALAARPQGSVRDGRQHPPSTLDPGKADAFSLVVELLAELIPQFPNGRHVHVGLDEPWGLLTDGHLERASDYTNWLSRLRDLPALRGREMLVWGDVLAQNMDMLSSIPAGVTVCEWGYEADHDFEEGARRLVAAGLPFWVCPGTSSWASVAGRFSNARVNLANAAEAARAHGASGYLVTDWGDHGHLQYLPVSEPGLLLGAAYSWCLETNRDLDLGNALSEHAFNDASGHLAAGLLAMGDLWQKIPVDTPWLSVLALPLYHPAFRLGDGPTAAARVGDYQAACADLDRALDQARQGRPLRADGALILDEVAATADLLRNLIHNAIARLQHGGAIEDVPPVERRKLAAELEPVISQHRQLWLARNRPGGLDESAGHLEALLRSYRA
ncbi:MAG: family 20 glycosylhydrolase [Candidatus Dormibacteria bacterium]